MSRTKILVLRFSAMGDVALVVPVIRSLVAAHPNVEVTIVTRPRFAPFFYDIERVEVFPADVDHTYNGMFGMRDLFKALIRKASYDVVVDLHDHLRSIILRTLFRLFFTDVIVFKKGRKEKKAFARKKNKIRRRLPHTVERYQEAFARAGFAFDLTPPPCFPLNENLQTLTHEWLADNRLKKEEHWIGLAPFAMHATKIWPLDNYPLLIEAILRETRARFFLFGGGEKETQYFKGLQKKFPEHCVVTAGQLKIRQEIALMKHMDLMVCVDSANMHLASLAGVPVLSIWGGTDPGVGFAPLGTESSVIQISHDALPCRPCSVYGRATCYVGGYPCLTRIDPGLLTEQIIRKLTGQTNNT